MAKILRVAFIVLVMLGLAAPVSGSVQAAVTPTFVIHPDQPLTSVSPLMLGSNAPAWLGSNYYNSAFIARTKFSGLKYLRIPGGSWSDSYGWLNCENRTFTSNIGYQCGNTDWSSWVTRPTDFINFLRATNQQAIYIVNVNSTAQESAALVAFFNGNPADTRTIGVDRNGKDWLTVGHWAQLRVDHGNVNPFYIKYWDVGNEVYGATQGAGGSGCASWGWENSWTCSGATYINGDSTHDGYSQIRAAMKAVDSTVMVGAVGTEIPTDYNNWGINVVQNAGSTMDYLIVHPYTYGTPPANTATGWATVLDSPRQTWPALKSTLQATFVTYASGRQIPIAADEYNLVYSHDLDTNKMMTTAGNMLFMSESIGQAISNGYSMFDQWSLSNGCSSVTQSCYDMLLADNNFVRSPQYYAFLLWSRFGGTMLKVDSNITTSSLSAYAGQVDLHTYTLLVINKTGQSVTAAVTYSDAKIVSKGTADVIRADTLNSTSVIFNNQTSIPDDLTTVPPLPLYLPRATGKPAGKPVGKPVGKPTKFPSWPSQSTPQPFQYIFAPYSITLLKMMTP